ncbi:TIGR03085 family metal-binding protein [Rhodococcus sp. IEGM 1379]|uniref:TIGR03085 family metal-binding protein n=1 Tax=Rhodococcus sp. IEGM 1379 TaxID=3047086 RepID=UPI0024B83B0B|nr:TIGR03085 family metal-binding protein [Rhodococcus sp. IEGM 1379]MDI9918055.1 TIGR03085 family metal-binding protein [Rhodococcus sp. IEGM 1379]
MTFAHDERLALVDSMAEFGPDAPTLCGEWTNRDLAAHLIIRERRLDAAPGIMISALAGHTESVRKATAARPWDELLHDVRSGPPTWSPMYWFDAQINTTEMFVHHEDVRRAHQHWTARALSGGQQAQLWKYARQIAKMGYRKAPVEVIFELPSGESAVVHKSDSRTVVLQGEPAELLLHAFGRNEVLIEAKGELADVQSVMSLDRSV